LKKNITFVGRGKSGDDSAEKEIREEETKLHKRRNPKRAAEIIERGDAPRTSSSGFAGKGRSSFNTFTQRGETQRIDKRLTLVGK